MTLLTAILEAQQAAAHFNQNYEVAPVCALWPELQSEDSICGDPLPAGQVWAISPGGLDENPGLFRIEVTEGPGSGVKILNQPAPAPFKESVRCAEQNLYRGISSSHPRTARRTPPAPPSALILKTIRNHHFLGLARGDSEMAAVC